MIDLTEKNLFIKAYCKINQNLVKTESGIIFENTANLKPSDWLKFLYVNSGIQYPKFYKMDLLSKAAFLCAEWLNQKHNFENTNTPLIFSNRTGSLESDLKHQELIENGDLSNASPAVFVYTLPNIAMGEISIRHQLHSKNVFLIFEEFGNENWINTLKFSFQKNNIEQVLGAWLEANDTELDLLFFLIDSKEDPLYSQPLNKETLQKIYKN